VKFRAVITSPLIHFFAWGGLIFAGYGLFNDVPAEPAQNAIVLTPQQATRLADRFAATWRRPPTTEELGGLMRSWAEEEAFVREALALGLDRDDEVIRRRLSQKMQFLAESGAAALEPDDAALQAFLEANPDSFARPAQVAFQQVMLPSAPSGDARAIRVALDGGQDPATLGSPTLLPAAMPLTPDTGIDRVFGEGFSAALEALPQGSWQGPVTSSYGQHLVRVTERIEASLPTLAEVRNRVEGEWRASRATELRDAFALEMLSRYTVVLPEPQAVLGK
jgi:hypothetical protein